MSCVAWCWQRSDLTRESAAIEYRHLDVFASAPLTGNGLIVALASPRCLRPETVVSLTSELRQFELIVVGADRRGNR